MRGALQIALALRGPRDVADLALVGGDQRALRGRFRDLEGGSRREGALEIATTRLARWAPT